MPGEYGEIMRFLMYHRERYSTEEEFRHFLTTEIRKLVLDLRDFDIIISVLPEFLKPRSLEQVGTPAPGRAVV
jgi:hypothetical protein